LNVFNFMIVSIVTLGAVIALIATLNISVYHRHTTEGVNWQRTHYESSSCERHDESSKPPFSSRHLLVSPTWSNSKRSRKKGGTYPVGSESVIGRSGYIEESTDEIRDVTPNSLELVNGTEIGERMSR
jgi:hypothetical protein